MTEMSNRLRRAIERSSLSEAEAVAALTAAESRRKRNGQAPKAGTYSRRDMRAED